MLWNHLRLEIVLLLAVFLNEARPSSFLRRVFAMFQQLALEMSHHLLLVTYLLTLQHSVIQGMTE